MTEIEWWKKNKPNKALSCIIFQLFNSKPKEAIINWTKQENKNKKPIFSCYEMKEENSEGQVVHDRVN